VLVVLDSTVLVADRFLESNDLRLLLSAARAGSLRIGVAEVSVLESVNKVRENAAKAISQLTSAIDSLAKLRAQVADLITDVTPEGIAASYETFLRRQLAVSGVEILAIPTITHLAVVQRALARDKPFDDAGRGYRDTLIWETVREAAAATGEGIAFVSGNHRDFAHAGQGSPLAGNLRAELSGDETQVDLFHDLELVLKFHVQPAMEALRDLRARLDIDAAFRRRLATDVEDAVGRHDPDLSGLNTARLIEEGSAGYKLEEGSLHPVDPAVTHVEIVSARSLNDDEILLDLSAECDAEVTFQLRLAATDPLSLGPFAGSETDRSDDAPELVTGTKVLTLRLTLEATYRPKASAISGVRLVAASTLRDPEEERREQFRWHMEAASEWRSWEKRAISAARAWAEEEGYTRVSGESATSLTIRGDDATLLVELVAEPDMITWLRAAARTLFMSRDLRGGGDIRSVIVLGHRIDATLATRVAKAVGGSIELRVLVENELQTL